MHLTCPTCAAEFPLEAGFIDSDGKRLAALFAPMEPVLGRAVLGYLRLFKPPKNALRAARAVKLVQALMALVDAGSVCRDERGGARRPATPAMWAAGIDAMLDGKHKLETPLGNHNYLRAIVYGLADAADAEAERKCETERRAVRTRSEAPPAPDPVREQIAYARQQREYGQITPNQFEAILEKLRTQDAARKATP